mgnify:CR=1 FL=1|tara:strand:+ start:963 stop:1157 length:195 start_codon:yes stop_codon:yes gene_type:complete
MTGRLLRLKLAKQRGEAVLVEEKIAGKIEREFSNDADTKKFESSTGTRLSGGSRGKVEQLHKNP